MNADKPPRTRNPAKSAFARYRGISAELEDLRSKTKMAMSAYAAFVKAVAEALLIFETLDQSDVDEIVAGVQVY